MAHPRLCQNCGAIIRGRADKQYCCAKCRHEAWVKGESEANANVFKTLCYYCGDPAGTIDHVPPQAFRARIGELGLDGRFKNYEIPACSECNGLLGSRPLWTPSARKKYIKRALRKRYRRVLLTADFTDSEIKEFGPSLSSAIISSMILKERVRNRLRW